MPDTNTSNAILLSLIIFLPTLGALVLAFFPKSAEGAIKQFSLAVTLAVFVITAWMAIPGTDGIGGGRFDLTHPQMQNVCKFAWIPSFNIEYFLGIDGISLPLVLLTSFLSMLSMWASWPIVKHVKAYCILFLLLETGMLGVFMSLDFFLFYVFWEVMLLPMYFLIGIWGGPRREYAAIKFFLYTLLGSVLMLIAILMLYFTSDLTKLSPDQLAAAHATVPAEAAPGTAHSFNLLALKYMGQTTKLFTEGLQWWAFLLLFIGFAVKVPSVPVHTWLPDAHVEAPTPISMILAGVLLKMGGYGILRICYPICPHGGYDLRYFVCTLGVVSMVYGAFAALAQKDFKRLVAYSSVSHMGYVVLGLGVWSAVKGQNYVADYWQQGVNGAMFQMIGHGISSAGMFFLVGVVYDRVHHRNLDQFGGLFARMPVYGGISMVIFFAALGLPGLCGFIGEVFVTLSVWNFSKCLAVLSASVVVLTAGYILWTLQRVYLGPEYKGPHPEALTPMTARELGIAAPLVALAILFGVYPQCVLNYMTPSIDASVQELANWTRDVKEASPLATADIREMPADAAVEKPAVMLQAAPADADKPAANKPAPAEAAPAEADDNQLPVRADLE
ncbi:MAG: NuoM family protein [Pirellulales bacterium]